MKTCVWASLTVAVATLFLSGCGMLDTRHWLTTSGRVVDMTDGTPKAIAGAWVRVIWSHEDWCLNFVQPNGV